MEYEVTFERSYSGNISVIVEMHVATQPEIVSSGPVWVNPSNGIKINKTFQLLWRNAAHLEPSQ